MPELSERTAHPDPVEQFRRWFEEAGVAGLAEPTAMVLATAGEAGAPSARVVLLKGVDARGFVFFTNYGSRKGRELAADPRVALVFHWAELGLQVRVEGAVEHLPPEDSDAYFQSRPRGSQLGATASEQSRVIASRDVLERRVRELEGEYAERDLPRPPWWGGYRVVPHAYEFWRSRPDRLHDRLRYRRNGDETWIIERLSP